MGLDQSDAETEITNPLRGQSMATKRKSLDMLDDDIQAKAVPLPVPAATGRTADSGRAKRGRPTKSGGGELAREGRVGMTVFYPPEVRTALRQLSLDETTTVQALVGEAIDLLMRSRGKHPFGAR